MTTMIIYNLLSLSSVKGIIHQVLIVILINIPTLSFGLAFGWVSLVSGEDGQGESEAVVAGVTTFSACMVGVPLSAWAISIGRKFAIIATSFLFVLCWSLKLASGSIGVWAIVCARVVAGLGGASAWALAPLLAREMCSDKYRGAAVTTLPLMNNLGILLMYVAADAGLAHSTILWLCLGVSAVHCFVSLFMPESPAFLAAQGKTGEAQKSLAWLRGMSPDDSALSTELATLPTPEPYERSPFGLAKAMLSDPRRRKAFIIGTIAIVGQEMCGILAIMQYAERVFILAGDIKSDVVTVVPEVTLEVSSESLTAPSRHAVMLGAVQFVFSALALCLVERVGRRPLLVSCAALTGAALVASAVLVSTGSTRFAAIGLAAAVAADAAGLQPAPYSLFADMFDYEFRTCALMLASAGANAGNTLESAIFPAVVSVGGLTAALALGAVVTLVYAIFAAWTVPETKDRTPQDIYKIICPHYKSDCETGAEENVKSNSTINNNVIFDENLSKFHNNHCKKIELINDSRIKNVNAKQKKCHQDMRDPSYRTDKIDDQDANRESVHEKIISNIYSKSDNANNTLKYNNLNKVKRNTKDAENDSSKKGKISENKNEINTRNYYRQRDFDDCFD